MVNSPIVTMVNSRGRCGPADPADPGDVAAPQTPLHLGAGRPLSLSPAPHLSLLSL